MVADLHHEEAFVGAFIVPAKRNRYSSLVAPPKRRAAILRHLYHSLDLDLRFANPVPPHQKSAPGLLALAKGRGAPTSCRLISTRFDLEQRDTNLAQALELLVGCGDGTVISCLPGCLAYFKPESLVGADGTRRLADDVFAPSFISEAELANYHADLFYESATADHPNVKGSA